MEIIQFGKIEDELDTRATIFITDSNFIVVKGYVDSMVSDLKEKENCLIANLVSLELNETEITVRYLNAAQKQKMFCIHDLISYNFDSDKNVTIDSLESLYTYLGKTYFKTETIRKETISEVLLSSFVSIFFMLIALLITYIIWFDTSLIYREHGVRTLRTARKNFVLKILGDFANWLGYNLAGGIFLALAGFLAYRIIKKVSNKKDIKVFVK